MLRTLVNTQCVILILYVCVLPGCVAQPAKPRHFGMYRLDPIRDALHIDGTVYDDAQSIGTVQEIVVEEDGVFLMIEFREERFVKNTVETTIEQSEDGRLYFRSKSTAVAVPKLGTADSEK